MFDPRATSEQYFHRSFFMAKPSRLQVIPQEASALKCLNLKEVAALLGISYKHCTNQVAAGVIPHTKIGHRIIVRVSDLERFLDKNTVGLGV
jgi:excisionase family DNA binding protein